MTVSFLQDMFDTIAERGRRLVEASATSAKGLRSPRGMPASGAIGDLCRAVLSGRGEASGVALARQILDLYGSMGADGRRQFFHSLVEDFGPNPIQLKAGWTAYEADPSPDNYRALLRAVEPPRQELIRRLNLAPRGTGALVAMREDLLAEMAEAPELASLDHDLVHLFYSWFNRGFLTLRRITWTTPADILERIIRYEAVHAIRDWDDLRRRIQPIDRRCYAFFHPALVDDPLIFVEVALTRAIPASIDGILAEDRETIDAARATTAVFYSISNCQPGLRGVSFGNFLIKQVVEELSQDLPFLNTFVTLSPIPGFRSWLDRAASDPSSAEIEGLDVAPLALLDRPDWHLDGAMTAKVRPLVEGLAATYLMRGRSRGGQPIDPVARFHLGNGARLERLNWLADTSPKGMQEAAGLMVNYLYDRATIEKNHEAYANLGSVVASKAMEQQLRRFLAASRSGNAHV